MDRLRNILVVALFVVWGVFALGLGAWWEEWPTHRRVLTGLAGLGVLLTLIVVVLVVRAVEARGRRGQMRRLARHLGLTYAPADLKLGQWGRRMPGPLRSLAAVALNALAGEYEGHPVRVFDLHPVGPKLSEGRHPEEADLEQTVLVLEHEADLPRLEIAPCEAAADHLGDRRLEFDSIEFTRAFHVRCADREFACAVCHPRMMEQLLLRRELYVLIDGHRLAIGLGYRLSVEEIPGRLQQLVEIRNLFPEYLFRD